jgi:DNA-binding XRE family transcriptional regulator
MSTAIRSYQPDAFGRQVVQGVVENAVFSAFYNLVTHRREEGYTKAMIAERMDVDRAAVTKLTSSPTNMKISTMAALANALDADICFFLVDRKTGAYIFSPVGTHTRTYQNVSLAGAHPISPNFMGQALNLTGQAPYFHIAITQSV